MKQILKTVFELDEVKDKAIEYNRYINVDFDWWSKDIINEWETKLENRGFSNPKIYFSGFSCQGDGACFDADIDINKLLASDVCISEKNREILEKIKDDITVKIEGHDLRYCHAYTRHVYIYNNPEEYEAKIPAIEEELNEMRIELCNEIYNDLQDEYYYLISDTAVEETLIANEYLFEENGEIYK